jgi:2-deoxystreptamine N-acetyl-D-glucosaminyltransferase/2-deoxystreptamine glucosyltransferase
VRQPAGAAAILRSARDAEVIYSTGMYTRSAFAARATRTPLVMKLASDPAFERGRRSGRFDGRLEAFQERQDDRVLEALKRLRNQVVRSADRVIFPSRYLARVAEGWGLRPGAASVVPNPAPVVTNGVARPALRRRLDLAGPTFVFTGRLVQAKNLPLALAALGHIDGARLVIVGDGPEREQLREAVAARGLEGRVRLTGAVPRGEAIDWMRAADAVVLPSDWENFPHAAVEALAAGTPVIATAVGGVPEIVENDKNGLLVERGDEEALSGAMTRVAADPELRDRLARGAADSASRFSAGDAFAAIERDLQAVSR